MNGIYMSSLMMKVTIWSIHAMAGSEECFAVFDSLLLSMICQFVLGVGKVARVSEFTIAESHVVPTDCCLVLVSI